MLHAPKAKPRSGSLARESERLVDDRRAEHRTGRNEPIDFRMKLGNERRCFGFEKDPETADYRRLEYLRTVAGR